MVSIDTPVAEWLESVVADPDEKCEILNDLLGDNLTMSEFTPSNMDDDMLGAQRWCRPRSRWHFGSCLARAYSVASRPQPSTLVAMTGGVV